MCLASCQNRQQAKTSGRQIDAFIYQSFDMGLTIS